MGHCSPDRAFLGFWGQDPFKLRDEKSFHIGNPDFFVYKRVSFDKFEAFSLSTKSPRSHGSTPRGMGPHLPAPVWEGPQNPFKPLAVYFQLSR